jgi:hypothetical protein
MSHQYRVRNHEEIHFVTFTIVDWIDIFIRPTYKQLIIDSLYLLPAKKGIRDICFLPDDQSSSFIGIGQTPHTIARYCARL